VGNLSFLQLNLHQLSPIKAVPYSSETRHNVPHAFACTDSSQCLATDSPLVQLSLLQSCCRPQLKYLLSKKSFSDPSRWPSFVQLHCTHASKQDSYIVLLFLSLKRIYHLLLTPGSPRASSVSACTKVLKTMIEDCCQQTQSDKTPSIKNHIHIPT